jgi:heme a synthase
MTAIRKVAAITALAIFVQILLGALTRLTDSGLSCPDWPLCYGLWFPSAAELTALEADYTFWQVMSEWTHRFNAAVVVGPLTLVLLIMAWRKRQEAPAIFKLMVAASLLLLVQAGLGGFTVLDRNSPWSVAVHLGVALVLLAQVLLVYLRARNPSDPQRGAAHALVWPAAALALATVASGAMVAKSGASLACSSWPLCDGALIPDLSDPGIALNFGHRVLALATAVIVGMLWLVARRGERTPFQRASNMAFWVLVLQVALGAGVIHAFSGDSLFVQVLVGVIHQGIGVVLFANLAMMARLDA